MVVVTSSDETDTDSFTDDDDVEEEQYEFSDTEFNYFKHYNKLI